MDEFRRYHFHMQFVKSERFFPLFVSFIYVCSQIRHFKNKGGVTMEMIGLIMKKFLLLQNIFYYFKQTHNKWPNSFHYHSPFETFFLYFFLFYYFHIYFFFSPENYLNVTALSSSSKTKTHTYGNKTWHKGIQKIWNFWKTNHLYVFFHLLIWFMSFHPPFHTCVGPTNNIWDMKTHIFAILPKLF